MIISQTDSQREKQKDKEVTGALHRFFNWSKIFIYTPFVHLLITLSDGPIQ